MSFYSTQGAMPGRGLMQSSTYIRAATGGDTVQMINGYMVHTFTTVGTSTFTPATSGLVDILVVAGGGGGGGNSAQSHAGGGGGSGGLYYAEKTTVSGPVTVTVGASGTGEVAISSSSWIASTAGGNSAFGSLTVQGGGRGGHQAENGGPGGSGGGGGRGFPPGGTTGGASTKTIGFGNAGGGSGSALGGTASAGSGGGAGSIGLYSYNDSIRTPGGGGFTCLISGTPVTYAAGGDGGARNLSGNGTSASPNTGSGGGGGDGSSGVLTSGGNGGSGIVIVRYPVIAPMTGTPLFSQLSVSAASNMKGAFSLRAINGTTAKAVQVKRQSDNATQDFYADRLGNLLTAPVTGQSLANWLGSSMGNVLTWYDQSGLGNHASQLTAANQPIVNLSNVTISFNGNQWLSNASTTGMFIPLFQNTYSVVTKHRQWTVGAAWSTGNTASFTAFSFNGLRWAASNLYQNYRGGGFLSFGPQPGTYPVVATVVNDRTNDIGYINGVQSATQTGITPNVESVYSQYIGFDANTGTNRLQGELHAVVFFSSAISTADRTIIESLI